MRHLAGFLRQRFVVIRTGSERIERQIELVFPAEFEARFRHGVIADLRARMAFGEVCGVGRDFVGDEPLFHILFIRQAEVLFWRHVAEHGTAEPADHGWRQSRT
ncbi:Uncharacterised protein [Atlantibacter hermannii]|nr:Uncharacterised protein [Atlantibacter hermannii]